MTIANARARELEQAPPERRPPHLALVAGVAVVAAGVFMLVRNSIGTTPTSR